MAGNLNKDSVIWAVGETGHAPGIPGTPATVPAPKVQAGSGVPSGAPTAGTPFYVNTANNKLYAWTGATWVAVSGANT
jgi:hypothetical protein